MRTKFSTIQSEVGQALACMSVNDCPRGFRAEELNFSISFGKWVGFVLNFGWAFYGRVSYRTLLVLDLRLVRRTRIMEEINN